ncbi:DNA repair protein RAD51 homolog 3 [Eurytemora carolleeae]|uniref:DNA repair protein RAD51 homolog 3 n=1 Tax=Eurytemora carolleeae TaxID=1294199 RepID=UPI000C79009C|nr:DNA repair protein RAD51 homolog 3 [Eurytemora carolleeae]|eukprot:XP_023348317.1 DNA repair protein RAD51 homolog 3-like [Eurytemora affinis]
MEGLTTVLNLLNSNIQLGRLSTGCTGLDQLLKGGLEYGKITELYGEAGVGKTCFILDLAVRLAAGDCNTVILETEGKLSTPRLKQIIDNFSSDTSTSSSDSLLDRIWIRKCRSQQELISSIYLLPIFIKNKGNVKAIFVDSIAFLFRYTEDKEDQFSNPG